jgi:hypothetical protein
MPIFDTYCDVCALRTDDVFLKSSSQPVCPSCKGISRKLPCAPAITGPTDTKPFIHGQTSTTCTTPAQKRERERKQSEDGVLLSADSIEWKRHRDRAREKADKKAKKRGYRDFADQQQKKGASMKSV